MKKIFISLGIGAGVLVVLAFLLGRFALPYIDESLPELPKPELSEGQRGELGIDKNINEETIDKYLGRSDAVYRDVRMLKDPGNYEAIGGDANLSGYVDGFEVVPFPYLVNVTGLPEAVGGTYAGETLFTEVEGKYTPNYVESMAILEDLFPKDKVIFLLCGGGGYSGMLRRMLIALGWNEEKIYDVGGYWFYKGENAVTVKRIGVDGKTVYDFYKVPYHEIDFKSLTPVSAGELVDITVEAYEEMISQGRSFLLFVDQDGCTTADKLRKIVKDYTKSVGGFAYRIMYGDLAGSSLSDTVKYYPSVAVVKDGQVVKALRSDADEDAGAYNNYDDFLTWVASE